LSKQKKLQQYIYKIDSNLLEKKKWDLILSVEDARKIDGLIVALADSQVLSWINELNGTQDYDSKAKVIKKEIKWLKKQPTSKENKIRISELYKTLYKLQFKEDYVCVVMNKKSHYKRANKGFKINGIRYKRLFCTTGGVKMSTVVYASERVVDELKKRINNGRNEDIPIVPAKYGAYESLVASGSLEVSWPRDENSPIPGGVIVVKDCFTSFKADVINVDDSNYPDEPMVELMKDQDIKNDCSDGCSIITPELSRRWNGELNGDYSRTCSGFNLRNAFLKGMTFTFDIVKFAEEVVGASDEHPEKYLIEDVWGTKRDIRDALLIVTESQLKLNKGFYSSWEDYYYKCIKNKYTFRIAKTAPYFEDLDEVRQLNYQFIAPLDLNDNDIEELISPTVQEIKDIMGLDVRKTIAYLCGKGLDDDTAQYADIFAKALMIEPKMIDDPFIRNKIRKMIARRIKDAKIGVLDAQSNFQIISGDLYALAESMFKLEPKGLLKSGEIYSKFWVNKAVDKVLCARAPMSNEHSLLTQNVASSEDINEWFKYMDSVVVVNAWDTMPAALNGFDFDGDLLYTTTNQALMRNQTNLPALRCIQRNAAKKIVTEEELIKSNLQGFGSQIGQITNRCTSITSLMANYSKDSEEYKILKYRTQCFQNGQQNEIDKAKGIVTEPLPKSWWVMKENRINDDDSPEEIERKTMYAKLCANKKPYFFAYNYSSLKTEYDSFIKNAQSNAVSLYKKDLDRLIMEYENGILKDENEIRFMRNFYYKLPLDRSKSTMNRICWAIEREFDGVDMFKEVIFDYSILKNNLTYDQKTFDLVKHICNSYKPSVLLAKKNAASQYDNEIEEDWQNIDILLQNLVEALHSNCPNEDDLCNILVDLCYGGNISKQILWKACGDVIINRLLKSHGYKMSYPQKAKDGEFWCQGIQYTMKEIVVKDGDKDETV
jgi:hypothetical protein